MDQVERANLGNNNTPIWGEGVKVLRHLKGWTQAKLAETAQVSQPHISDIENGSRQLSDAARVRIAKALGSNPHKLFPYIDEEAEAS